MGFRYSTDFGKTWHETPHTPSQPLFGEPANSGGKVKMGAPHLADFGKNMQYSPDGKAYLVGQGAETPTQAKRCQPQLDYRRSDLHGARHAQHPEHERRREV